MDLHAGPAVAVPAGGGVNVGRHLALGQELEVEPGRRHACDDRLRGLDDLPALEPHGRRAPVRDENSLDVGAGSHLAAGVADDPYQAFDELPAASPWYRHPAELERAGDHLRHEARDGVVRP